ncbi:iron-sulfur cluster assembly scaffold protein [Candidatus Contubernalis alkaliaceticus]|uniref:iron-sulfur cluster assembly scaffold protein n=1 Tax=Candidatus Contubernalis alkaliaceticus TaxID=338645 RepID=UPI001F4C1839|nr:iron-sulfur cluster assembly scaffold protein [Candidatus Contubernalis alkalaceticus]UNC92998.1 iron-sulfur cluster assembly scaffold protein [Candidatus Contubernalis alkalaceticus]
MENQLVVDHFTNPRNIGDLPDAHGIGTYGAPDCGDYLVIYIKVNREKISDIKYKIYGCSTLIATTSMMTEMAKGKTIQEARLITGEDVVKALGGLPEDKTHCANLSITALHFTFQDFNKRKSLGWTRY